MVELLDLDPWMSIGLCGGPLAKRTRYRNGSGCMRSFNECMTLGSGLGWRVSFGRTQVFWRSRMVLREGKGGRKDIMRDMDVDVIIWIAAL